MTDRLTQTLANAASLHDTLANSHPALQRGLVQCRQCGTHQHVDSAHCLRHGWPKCCGETMLLQTA